MKISTIFISKDKKCVNKCKTLHKGWTMDCDINNNTLNTEVSWCFSSCRWHLSYNFCWTLGKIFQSVFRNIEISSKLSVGKWKCRHMLICDIVPYVNSSLIFLKFQWVFIFLFCYIPLVTNFSKICQYFFLIRASVFSPHNKIHVCQIKLN